MHKNVGHDFACLILCINHVRMDAGNTGGVRKSCRLMASLSPSRKKIILATGERAVREGLLVTVRGGEHIVPDEIE
jgi:hypothetical protein